jgi:UDP-N-acetylmuramate dehydrogenase
LLFYYQYDIIKLGRENALTKDIGRSKPSRPFFVFFSFSFLFLIVTLTKMLDVPFKKLTKILPGLKRSFYLKKQTTFKIGGPAFLFFEARKKEDLAKAIRVANELNIPFFILGGGSNILFSDKGFPGLVIKVNFSRIEYRGEHCYAEAGAPLSRLVNLFFKNSMGGLEWAVGIPGTAGGAVRGNAGAFGGEISDLIETVEFLELKEDDFLIRREERDFFNFSYRESYFKNNKNCFVLSLLLRKEKGNKKEMGRKMKDFLRLKRTYQPLSYPSAGSVFKNPPANSAKKLIEEAGLAGKKIGQAQIATKHPNFIINTGKATSEDVLRLIQLAKEKVKVKSGIVLEEEIKIVN